MPELRSTDPYRRINEKKYEYTMQELSYIYIECLEIFLMFIVYKAIERVNVLFG